MSVGPIESFPPAKVVQVVGPSLGSGQAESSAEPGTAAATGQSGSGTLPKQETPAAKSVPVTYELPEDVVEVHQDPETRDQITEYLDKAKNVIFQVPSSEEVSVERGIAEELQQAAKLRASAVTAAAASDGGKTHGD
ncbi:MAG: hypothetical protein ABSG02_01835 [Terriglobales bacterium]|jgi:hypothetical protein